MYKFSLNVQTNKRKKMHEKKGTIYLKKTPSAFMVDLDNFVETLPNNMRQNKTIGHLS